MSVKIEFIGKCKNCTLADLELREGNQLSRSSGEYIHLWKLRCKHEEACDKWNHILGVSVQNGVIER